MSERSAPLDRLDPRTRVLAALAFCIAASFVQTAEIGRAHV